MKSKTPLTLMELLVMVLVFSLASALCVQIFVTADRWSRENEWKDRAVLSVQNAAETIKAVEGDLKAASERLGGRTSDAVWTVMYDAEGKVVAQEDAAVYDVTVELTDSGHRLLGTASVTAREIQKKNEVFRITAAWQEVEHDE